MIKYPHIERFENIKKYIEEKCNYDKVPLPVLKFTGTIKLHGANGGIVVSYKNREYTYELQSRNRTLEQTDMNSMGFTEWGYQESVKEFFINNFKKIIPNPKENNTVVYFGEWCGIGIQKGMAISNLPKFFAPFSLMINDKFYDSNDLTLLDSLYSYESRIFPIPFAGYYEVIIDFNDKQSIKDAMSAINFWLEKIEKQCPFGTWQNAEGPGEGIVFKADWNDEQLMFKCKVEKFDVIKKGKLKEAIKDEGKEKRIDIFIESVLTEERLLQGLSYIQELNLPVDKTSIGTFNKWINDDVKRECLLELNKLNLEWQDVRKKTNKETVEWFYKQF